MSDDSQPDDSQPADASHDDEPIEGEANEGEAIEAAVTKPLSADDIDHALKAAAAGPEGDDADVRDTLPEDLDASGYVGPYLFPNNSRRRVPGVIYMVFAVILFGLWVTHRSAPQILDQRRLSGCGHRVGPVRGLLVHHGVGPEGRRA